VIYRRAATTPGLGGRRPSPCRRALPFGRAASLFALASLASACDLRIGEPRALWLLWLVPVLAAFAAFTVMRRAELTRRLVAAELISRLVPGASPGRLWLKSSLLLVAVAALVLALAQPRYGFAWEEVRRRGVDLVVAFDLSDSMLVADDAAGSGVSRLERAKRKLNDLTGMLEGDRVGLVAFAGAAFVECPLTLDYGAFLGFVDALEPGLISAKGTSLADAVRASLRAFDGGTAESRAILLVTDGEDTVGEAAEVTELAKSQGVRVYALGVGRPEGAPIPRSDGSFRRDSRGELVLSKLDERGLEALALGTGGAYVRSVTGDADLDTLYHRNIKRAVADRELESQRRQRWHERYQWLVGLALALLVAELFLPERVRRKNA
jgi:Ca-activated chloride channel family protein